MPARSAFAAGLALAMLAGPIAAKAALPIGATAPTFTTRATLGGQEFDASLATMLRKGPVVLYFFPAAFTKGCTIEAHDFAEAMPEFHRISAQILGISEDKIETLNKFSVSACQSQFPVASDPHGNIAKQYDARIPLISGYANRISYAIAPDGRILASYAAMNPDQHVARMIDALKAFDADKEMQTIP